MRLLVTGSRKLSEMDLAPISSHLHTWWERSGRPDAPTLVHGAAPGADRLAASIWRNIGWPTEPHPADWSLGRKAGPIRNQEMVDSGADACLAFLLLGAKNVGTLDCLRRADRAGIPVWTYWL